MSISNTVVAQLIEENLENSRAIVTGDGYKYEAIVISPAFIDLTMVKKHQLVYATLNETITSGNLHALTIKTYTPDEWKKTKT